MSESKSTTQYMYDAKTILFRVFTVIVYIAFGSAIFHLLEKDEAAREVAKFEENYNKTMTSILRRFILNETDMKIIMAEIRGTFLQEVFPKEWDITGGVDITIQVITTIGYGNTTPRTVAGRMFLIIYATIGIPFMAMMLTTFGEKLKHMIRSSIISFERKILKRSQPQDIERKSVIAVFVITAVFLCFISAIGTIFQNWDFSVALYVWFVTMTTIGFGDYVPKGSGASNPILVALEYLYVVIAFFLSLTLMACIIHALSDWLNSTKPPSKDDLKIALSRIANSLSMHREEQPSIIMALPRPLPPRALPRPYIFEHYVTTGNGRKILRS